MVRIPVMVETVMANHTPRAMMNTAPWKSDMASTMTTGIHVVDGIAPSNRVKGEIQ